MAKVYIVNWVNDYNETMEVYTDLQKLLEEIREFLDIPKIESWAGKPNELGSTEFWKWYDSQYVAKSNAGWGFNIGLFDTDTLKLEPFGGWDRSGPPAREKASHMAA